MLPKEHRLRRNRDFNRVFKKGKSFFVQEIGIKSLPNNLEVTKIGIVVSTKLTKKAVERNRLKRQLREVIRHALPEIREGFDLMIITRPGILGKSYREIDEVVRKILGRLRLLKSQISKVKT